VFPKISLPTSVPADDSLNVTPPPPLAEIDTGPAVELPWKSWPMRACEARLAWMPTPVF